MNTTFNPDLTHSNAKRELLFYLLGTFVPVSLLALVATNTGGMSRNPWLVPVSMLTPMISAIFVQKLSGRKIFGSAGLGFRWGKLRWWLLAPVGFAVSVAAAIGLSVLVTPSVAASSREIALNITHHLLLPVGLPLPLAIALAIISTITLGPLVNLPILLGEEVGWRAFMNPRLLVLFGRPGLLVGGAIWAIWHLPFILLGHNYPQHPWLGMLVWIPVCMCLNILLQRLREVSGSIVACALAHGAINQLATLLLVVFIREDRFVDYLHGPAGVMGLLVFLPAAVWAYRNVEPPRQTRGTVLPVATGPVLHVA